MSIDQEQYSNKSICLEIGCLDQRIGDICQYIKGDPHFSHKIYPINRFQQQLRSCLAKCNFGIACQIQKEMIDQLKQLEEKGLLKQTIQHCIKSFEKHSSQLHSFANFLATLANENVDEDFFQDNINKNHFEIVMIMFNQINQVGYLQDYISTQRQYIEEIYQIGSNIVKEISLFQTPQPNNQVQKDSEGESKYKEKYKQMKQQKHIVDEEQKNLYQKYIELQKNILSQREILSYSNQTLDYNISQRQTQQSDQRQTLQQIAIPRQFEYDTPTIIYSDDKLNISQKTQQEETLANLYQELRKKDNIIQSLNDKINLTQKMNDLKNDNYILNNRPIHGTEYNSGFISTEASSQIQRQYNLSQQ